MNTEINIVPSVAFAIYHKPLTIEQWEAAKKAILDRTFMGTLITNGKDYRGVVETIIVMLPEEGAMHVGMDEIIWIKEIIEKSAS